MKKVKIAFCCMMTSILMCGCGDTAGSVDEIMGQISGSSDTISEQVTDGETASKKSNSDLLDILSGVLEESGVLGIDVELTADEFMFFGKPVTEWTYESFEEHVLSQSISAAEFYGIPEEEENDRSRMIVRGGEVFAYVYAGPDFADGSTQIVQINTVEDGAYYICRKGKEVYIDKEYLSFEVQGGYSESFWVSEKGIASGKYVSFLGMSPKDAMNSLYSGLYEKLQSSTDSIHVGNGSISMSGPGSISMGNSDWNLSLMGSDSMISNIWMTVWQ